MQIFPSKIVAKEHQAEFYRTVALFCVGAVLCLCFAVNMRVIELNFDIVIVASRLKIDTPFIIDTGNVMHAHFQGRIMSYHALQLIFICSEIAAFVTSVMPFTSNVWVNISSSSIA